MYLTTVLADIQRESAPPKALNAEHLYKMNEAIFNLPEEDTIDGKTSAKLFQAVTKIQQAYTKGNICDSDSNFFYDYVALLGTLQNQHFFSSKQTDKMLSWVKEAIDDGSGAAAAAAPREAAAGPSKGDEKKLKKLEDENKKLKDELAKLMGVCSAVEVLKAFKPEAAAEGKGKSKGKGKDKDKGKGKGKGKNKDAEEEEAEAEGGEEKEKKPKGKAKGKARAKEGARKTWKAKPAAEAGEAGEAGEAAEAPEAPEAPKATEDEA